MVIIATLISAILIIVVVLQFKEKRRVKKERDTQRRKEQRREMIMKTVAGLSAVMMKANTVRTKSQIEIVKNNFFNNAVGIYSNVISSLTVE